MLNHNIEKILILIIFITITYMAQGQSSESVHGIQGMQIPTLKKRVGMEPEPMMIPAPKGDYPMAQNLNKTPFFSLKTNLLYDATLSASLGLEIRMSRKTTMDISGGWRLWDIPKDRLVRHFFVQPESRLWMCEAFNGHFFGLHAHYGEYNVGGLPIPPFTTTMREYRFDGWLAGAGISYGYHWVIGKRWGLEATIGAGWAYLDYNKYVCGECGDKIGSETKNYFGPTKAGISLIYIIN